MKAVRIAALLVVAGMTASPMGARLHAQDVTTKTPVVIYILRHAEKPLGEGGKGEKNPNLSTEGFLRAKAIPSLFVTLPGATQPARFPRPDYLFATEASKGSNRPYETIMPLALAVHEQIDHDFADVETGKLASTLLSGKYAGKVVVVCWHHGEIPHLAHDLGVQDGPKKWDPDVFDRVWVVRWVDGKAQLTILPQRLMPDDAKQ